MAAVDNVEHQQQGVSIIRKRDRRHYNYQSSFNAVGTFYNIFNVPFIHTVSVTEYWTKNRRKWVEYLYPSFFMNIKRIPTYRWSCESFEKSDEWTCT